MVNSYGTRRLHHDMRLYNSEIGSKFSRIRLSGCDNRIVWAGCTVIYGVDLVLRHNEGIRGEISSQILEYKVPNSMERMLKTSVVAFRTICPSGWNDPAHNRRPILQARKFEL
jgi:hypothetical protein